MSSMHRIGHVDVYGLRQEIDSHPELWNKHTMRTSMFANSPHREVNDIWLRYNAWENFNPDDPCAFANEHTSVNYPAWDLLPSAGMIINELLNDGDELGGCLITKIYPEKRVYPHSDAGAWHSTYYETKLLVLVQATYHQHFLFYNDNGVTEDHIGVSGDIFEFDNHPVHEVVNNSHIDRISLIAAVRRKR